MTQQKLTKKIFLQLNNNISHALGETWSHDYEPKIKATKFSV